MGRFEIDNSDPARPRLLYVFSRKVNFSKKSKLSHSKNPKRDEGESKKWRESEKLELKSSLANIDKIVETVAAFASTKGGNILIGISNSEEVLGVDIGKDTIEKLTNKIADNTDPKIYPSISTEKIRGKTVIIIGVKESHDKPVLAYGKPFKRAGRSTMKISKAEYERMILEKYKERLQFDKQICQEARLKDIDEEKVKWFVDEARRQRGTKIEKRISEREVLMRLKLLRNTKFTNTAILLFGKEPQKFFSQAEVRCARFKGIKPVKPFIDMKVFGGNIIDQVDKAKSFVLEHTPMAAWLTPEKTQRKEKYDYPPDAIREAIVNAICHRNYSSTANVQIRIFNDRIEIWNPGQLPEGWTVEKLKQKHESIPKNPLIADQFFLIKFIEKWGTGTNDMIDACLDWGLPEPDFEYTGTSLIVIFRKSKLREDYLKTLNLNNRQIKAIEFLKEHKRITSKKYADLFGITDRTARNDLAELINKNVVVQKGESKKTTYYELS